MKENDDQSIVARVLEGDTDAFESLVRTYQAAVIRYCLVLLRNPVDAEEAAQDVFVKAFRSLSSFRGQSNFLTWAGRIAHNHCMDLLRRRKRHKTDSLDEILETNPARAEERLTESPTPDRPEIADRLPALLASLKPDHREILLLREVQELSYDEIASTLKCTLDTVKSRLRRARAEFAEKARHFMGETRV